MKTELTIDRGGRVLIDVARKAAITVLGIRNGDAVCEAFLEDDQLEDLIQTLELARDSRKRRQG